MKEIIIFGDHTPTDERGVARVLQFLKDRRVLGARLCRTPTDYYELSLLERREICRVVSVQQLCKTVLLRNVLAPEDAPDVVSGGAGEDITRSRYLGATFQYTRKFNAGRLAREMVAVHRRHGGTWGSKSNFKYRLAPEDAALALCGFEHNGVAPVALLRAVPLIVDTAAAALPFVVTGGGARNVKLQLPTSELLRVTGATVVDFCDD